MNFSTALELMKEGKALARKVWNNPNISVRAQYPDINSKMTKPYLYMIKKGQISVTTKVADEKFPIDLSCESIFAEDWFVVEE